MWNLLQPVNRLPPEIVSRVAQCVLGSHSMDVRSIIPLTHVCRYWRESIISAPENWTLVSGGLFGMMALSLERSKAAPLRLELCMMDCFRLRDLIIPRLQNIETLCCDQHVGLEDFIQTFPNFPRSTPNLRSLKLEHAPTWDPSTDPFNLFPNTMRSLSLYDIPLYPSFLGLRTLTDLSLHYYMVRPPLDAFLDLLGGNCSLERVDLRIGFDEFPVPTLRNRDVIMNQLQRLSITCWDATIARAVITRIPLRRGVHLEITFRDEIGGLGLNDILSDISVTHLSSLSSPTYMKYWSSSHGVRLTGPNGSFSYDHEWCGYGLFRGVPFTEFPVLPITNVPELHLVHSGPPAVFHPSSFPALETFTIEGDASPSHLLSALLTNPSTSPSLKTLEFRDCMLTEELMEELTRFASHRKNTTSTRLDRVAITHKDGKLPSTYSIRELSKHVPVVDVLTLG